MSLEGGTEDYRAGYSIGAYCPDCYSPVRTTELGGYCPRCAGVPAPPPPTRGEVLRRRIATFELAARKTPHDFNRRRYLARVETLSAELAELEAGERG